MDSKKIELEIFGLSSSHSQSGSFALVLGEVEGNRRLPIIIGMFEAQAIAIELEQIPPKRPMTHDLFKSFASGFGIDIVEIVITKLKEGVFYSTIVTTDGVRNVDIDSRPSDAIALALRFDVPIFTNEEILSEAGIILTEEEEEEESEGEELEEVQQEEVEVSNEVASSADISSLDDQELQSLLDSAIKDEDYERAAKLRDELNKRS